RRTTRRSRVCGGRSRRRPSKAKRTTTSASRRRDRDGSMRHLRISMALLIRGGSTREAASHLREAIRLSPDWPQPLNALAWLLATSPDPAVRDGERALRLAARAVELTASRNPQVLDTQAAAQAASGRFAAAVATERDAIQLISRS